MKTLVLFMFLLYKGSPLLKQACITALPQPVPGNLGLGI